MDVRRVNIRGVNIRGVNIRGFIFDFDNTLTNIHVYAQIASDQAKLDQLLAGYYDDIISTWLSDGTKSYFEIFVQTCIQQGIKIAIASYGVKSAINYILSKCFPTLVLDIYTPGQFAHMAFADGTDMGDHKVGIITKILSDMELVSNQVVLIDDDINNLTANGENNMVVMPFQLSRGGVGLTQGNFEILLELIKRNGV